MMTNAIDASGVEVALPEVLRIRKAKSLVRIDGLRDKVATLTSDIPLDGLTIFTVGSYGRLEASKYSDIDLFFVYEDGTALEEKRTSELRLFGRLIDAAAELDFPKFSNDAQYLQSHQTAQVLTSLGGADDDAKNYFTTRMLMLLESRCVFGEDAYLAAMNSILESYQRDFPNHEDDFRPWFLLNDIMRFWKTLLLNYEHKRNRAPAADAREGEEAEQAALRARVKNFKLKYSRALTCFATISAIGAHKGACSSDDLLEIVSVPPHERLSRVADSHPATRNTVERILEEYSWFLEQTALETSALESLFREQASRQQIFDRASGFGYLLFDLLTDIDAAADTHLLRSLVV